MYNVVKPSVEAPSDSSLPLFAPDRGFKVHIPDNAAVLRDHPPHKRGDFENGRYWWEALNPNRTTDRRIREAMWFGKERSPRCERCEKEDRACMAFLDRKSELSKCAGCLHRHLPCSHADVSPTSHHQPPPKDLRKRTRESTADKEASVHLDHKYCLTLLT